MNTKVSVVVMVTVAMTLFVASAGVLSLSVIAQQSQAHFIANLSGKSAIPPNPSAVATGKATFTVTDGGKKMSYSVNATKINHVDNVVLVYWPTGANRASNIVLLRTGAQHGATGPINGVLVQGTITSSDLVGPLKGKHISDLVRDMLNGNIDLWVTTTTNLMIAGKVTPAGAA
jgi:CHRD domain-containing protein